MACLAALIAAPRVFFSSTLSAAMPFISSVMRPALPRNCALAFSRSAGVAARGEGGCARTVDDGFKFVSVIVHRE